MTQQFDEQQDDFMSPVRNSNGGISEYNELRIVDSLLLETNLSREIASLVASKVTGRINRSGVSWLSGPLIREMTNSVLAEMNLQQARKMNTRVGVPMHDIQDIIINPQTNGSNANLMRNPETVAKVVHDRVMEEHTFLTLPDKLADAHLSGDIYIKDREYFNTRDYCATWDMRQFLIQGIAPGGTHSSYAKPAKSASVAMNHAVIWLGAAQSNYAGGQGFFFFNTFLAPFLVGMKDEQVKQVAQQLIFTLTQTYVSRGGQVVFSSIDLTPGIPKIMRDIPAVLPGGSTNGNTYGDYELEARRFFDQFIMVMIEGDGHGRPFNFPKPNIVLREEFMRPEYDESWRKVAYLTALHGSPYFESYLAPYRANIEAGCSSCCSHLWTASTDEELEEFKSGNMVFGSGQMVTPNFGRAAWLGKSDESKFFEKLDEFIDLSAEVLQIKDQIIRRMLRRNLVPFYNQPRPDGNPLIDPERRMYLLGTVGFAEMAKIVTGYDLQDREGTMFAFRVLKHLRQRTKEYEDDLGLKMAVTRTPAESAAGRLAKKDAALFPEMKPYINGNGSPYYSNSTQLNVAAPVSLSERIRVEGMFHPYMDGGALTNIFLGEANPDPDAIWELTKKVAKDTLNAYFAFTKDTLQCFDCNAVTGIDWKHVGTISTSLPCPRCHSANTEIYSRITGYSQGLNAWNPSKKAEFLDRLRYRFQN